MTDRNTEDIIGALYDFVQDARSMPLAADKCILERDKVLDMLDEIIAQLPSELKQSRTIVESRNELISVSNIFIWFLINTLFVVSHCKYSYIISYLYI